MTSKKIDKIFICNICDKKYSGYQSLWIHNKKFHKNEILTIENDNIENKEENNILSKNIYCTYCKKNFSRKDNCKRHEKYCKIKNNKLNESDELNRLKKMILELNKKVNKQKSKNITNNITNNINNNIIIQYGLEHRAEKLTNDEIIKIINRGWMALCESIKMTHFNSRIPQLHNIYIPDKKFNTIMVFKDKKFELDKLENVLYDLIDKHIENIKDWDPI